MIDYVAEFHEDLRTMLNRLSWAHNEPALHVAEHFAELRRQVDLDAERLLKTIHEKDSEDEAKKVIELNSTWMEFIRILEELEKRTGLKQKPENSFSEVYESLEQKVDSFKDYTRSLDYLEDAYIQLAREITDETYRVERRIFGEQTIIYRPSNDDKRLGSLVYFGDTFLKMSKVQPVCEKSTVKKNLLDRFQYSIRRPLNCSKATLVQDRIGSTIRSKFDKQTKFYYLGKSKAEYSGYSAEGSSLEREFVSYQFDQYVYQQSFGGNLYLDTSANLFDIYSSAECMLEIGNLRLPSLHANLLPSPTDRLSSLDFTGVHFETFDPNVLEKCTNLTYLTLQVTFSKQVKFELDFLRGLRKLVKLKLTLPDTRWDFSPLKELTRLISLKLENCSVVFAEPFPKLSREALEQIFSPPKLIDLVLSYFDIEVIDRKVLSQCDRNFALDLRRNRIGRIEGFTEWNHTLKIAQSELADWSWKSFGDKKHRVYDLRLMDVGICTLASSDFKVFTNLNELRLNNNSISELPPGVFDFIHTLERLDLSENLIRQIKVGSFAKSSNLKKMNLSGNPIEAIEANAFCALACLKELSLNGCRLKSIDNEMFNGLIILKTLELNNNLIERIEVVAEDGRRIDVTKADKTDQESQLIRERLFKDLRNLSGFDLNGNKLEKLDLNCFCNMKSLHLLQVSSNKINELRYQTSQWPPLKYLNLNANRMEAIDLYALPTTLKFLNLTGNPLSQLDDNFLARFLIRFSYQRDNFVVPRRTKITKLTPEDIQFISKSLSRENFLTLDFSGNLIETLDDCNLFYGINREIGEVNLSDNRLNRIHRDIFRQETILMTINLSKNKLSSVDLGLFRGLNSLRVINLSSNVISFLNLAGLFRAAKRLEYLNIADNQLDDRSTAEPIDTRSLYLLASLNLGGNRLEKMDFVRDMTNLKSLDLRGNRIESVMSEKGDENLLGRLYGLTHLDLSGNRIRSLRDVMFAHLCGQLEHLDISGNPLDIQVDSVLAELI